MTVKEALNTIAEKMHSTVSSIVKSLANADFKTLLKVGFVAGVAVVTIVAIFKFLKYKKDVFLGKKANRTIVDDGLEINYRDARNRDSIHPRMKKVRKALLKDSCRGKSKKKKHRIAKDLIDKYCNSVRKRRDDKDMYDQYESDMRETEANDNLIRFLHKIPNIQDHEWSPHNDETLLARIWRNTNHNYADADSYRYDFDNIDCIY